MSEELQAQFYDLVYNNCRLYTNRKSPHYNSEHVKKQKTHTVLGGPSRGTFCIEGNDYYQFLKLYKKLYKEYEMYFVERPLPVTYLLIDIDWWYKKGYLKREYKVKNHIRSLVKIVNKVLLTYFDVEKTDLLAFVHEKPNPTIKEKEEETNRKKKCKKKGECKVKYKCGKDGFHFFYPYVPLMFHHRHFILQKLEEEMSRKRIFKDIHYQPESNAKGVKTGTELHGIVDHSIVMNNGILMHGCQKEGSKPYKVTHIYNHHLENIGIEDYTDDDIVDLMLNRRFDDDDGILPKEDLDDDLMIELKKKSMMHLGPTERELWSKLSGGIELYKDDSDLDLDSDDNRMKGMYSDGEVDIDTDTDSDNDGNDEYDGVDPSIYDTYQRHEKEEPSKKEDDSIEDLPGLKSRELINSYIPGERDIYIAAKLTKLLSRKRATNYDSWLNVCFALHNISPRLFEVFNKFSRKTKKSNYSRSECKKKWEECRPNRYTLAAIYKWAREDSTHEVYTKTIDSIISPIIKKAMSGTHDDIANMVHTIYRDRYKCVSFKNDVWFEFQGHRWVETQSAYTLMENISGHASDEFFKYHSQLARSSYKDQGVNRDENWNKIKEMGKIHKNLKNNGFIKSVKECCTRKFFDPHFEQKLNNDHNLLGFDNGVFDLELGKFRPGCPDDYITFSVGYNYKKFKGTEKIFKEIDKYFSEIQTKKENKEYLMKFLASCAIGQPDQRFHVWTGGGANGKSTTQELLKKLYGDYYGVLPVTMFTRKRGEANAATPALFDKHGKRILFSQEPAKNDKIQAGVLKELTGADTITTRGLYEKKMFDYLPQFKIIMSCNDLPDVDARDGGTWRRIRTLPFNSTFVEGTPEEENEFKIDKKITKKFEEWRQPLMWLLLNKYFAEYKKDDYVIPEPKDVTEATNKYKKNTDIFYEFLSENFENTGNMEDKEPINLVYQMFKSEIKENYGQGKKIPYKKDFMGYLEQNYKKLLKYKKVDKMNIYGVKMVIQDDDK